MKRKKIISAIAVILAVLMVLSLMVSILPTAFAVSQSDIDALRAQKNALSERVAEAQARLEGLREQEAGVLEKKAALDEQNASAKAALELVAQEIAMYDEIIAEKTAELDEAMNREQEQLERYRTRVRAMEENGGYNILAVVVRSNNFSELLSGLDDMGEIMESDKELERQYRAARQEVERVKAEYEEVRADCEEKQAVLREEQAAIQAQINQTQEELDALADEIDAALAQYEAEQAAEQQAVNELTQMIAAYEEQKRQEAAAAAAAAAAAQQAGGAASGGAAAGGSTGGGGGGLGGGAAAGNASFSWPVPCSSRVTSRFGYRSDPFTGQTAGHAGIDIDGYGNDGQPVVAAAGGTVIAATNSGGYGNYVTIDHGNGYQTVYAHLASLSVSYGQSVSAGQTVGTLGSTGRSTGTHCHFEIRVNGSPTDPEAFFSGLSHWNC